MRAKPPVPLLHVLLLVTAALWGGAFVAIKELLHTASALTVTLLRFAITSIAFVPVLFPALRPRIDRGDRVTVLLLAFVGVGGYHLALNFGEHFVSAGVASLMVASMPVMVAVLSARLLGEQLDVVRRVGIALALVGVAVLAAWGSSTSRLEIRNLAGALIVLLAPICWSIYTVFGKPVATRYGAIPLTGVVMILGTLLVLPLTLPATIADLPRLAASDWAWLLFLGLGCTVLAYIVWYAALQTLEASTVAAYVYLVPLFSLVWAAALLGERPTVAGGLGGAMVLGGVVLSERVGPRYAKRPSASRAPRSPRPAARPAGRPRRVRASR